VVIAVHSKAEKWKAALGGKADSLPQQALDALNEREREWQSIQPVVNREISDSQHEKLKGLVEELRSDVAAALGLLTIVYRTVDSMQRQEVLKWISPTKYESAHRDPKRQAMAGLARAKPQTAKPQAAISQPREPESIVHLSHRTKDTSNNYLETSTGRTPMATSRTTSASGVATQRDIDESQELQDRGIKREFQTIRTYMDKRFELVDEHFELVDERFKEQRSYMDDRFQQVDDRFQQVDDRFQDLEVLMKNSRATSSWHDIFPVRVHDPLAEPRLRQHQS
jgi:hypothetical protein